MKHHLRLQLLLHLDAVLNWLKFAVASFPDPTSIVAVQGGTLLWASVGRSASVCQYHGIDISLAR